MARIPASIFKTLLARFESVILSILLLTCQAWTATTPPPDASVLPHLGDRPGHAGSADCRECHADQHASWHRSYHRTMTQLPTRDAVKADFNGVVLTNAGVRFTLNEQNNQFWVRMERENPGQASSSGSGAADVPLGLVTGSHYMQVFWVPNGMGNCQVGFPFTWLIPEKRWVPRNSTFIRPPNFQHRPETWNQVCARCHATAVEPGLNRAEFRWNTQAEELGISCEACHGAAEKHSSAMRELKKQGKKPVAGSTPLHIVNPEKLSAARSAQVCGFCHSMKWWEGPESWPVHGFTYHPGEDLEASTPIIRPNQLDKQPWLNRVLSRNPDLFSDFFWPDGMVRVSGRDYNGLIESPCYKGGNFSCLSCHSLHDSEPEFQLNRKRNDNRACLQCHDKFKTDAAQAAHSHHKTGSSGTECYNCHMPHTSYGVLKAIRSHQISSPSVQAEKATGRPNACNLCHLDKPLTWTARSLTDWFGQKPGPLDKDDETLANSVRLALSGDAGQRALLAWHFGWEPALEASGRDWAAPLLGELLDDPYSAVRCVAERSLKKAAPAFVPPGYDFTASPESRPPSAAAVMKLWMAGEAKEASKPAPAASGLNRADATKSGAVFGRLKSLRNNREMRLRE